MASNDIASFLCSRRTYTWLPFNNFLSIPCVLYEKKVSLSLFLVENIILADFQREEEIVFNAVSKKKKKFIFFLYDGNDHCCVVNIGPSHRNMILKQQRCLRFVIRSFEYYICVFVLLWKITT